MIDLSNIRAGAKDSAKVINYAVEKLGHVGRLMSLFPERTAPGCVVHWENAPRGQMTEQHVPLDLSQHTPLAPQHASLDLQPAQLDLQHTSLDLQHAPDLADRLVADPDGVLLGGDVREVTVLFADIRGFTQIAEQLDGNILGLSTATAAILDALSEVVIRHGGTLDKYMGDCLMAFWGAPGDDPIHAQRACAAAQEMLAVVASPTVKAAVAVAVGPDVWSAEISIGINTGRCFVGNHGSRMRFSYSVLGDAVNVASRLQQLSGAYDTPILIGEGTMRQLGVVTDYQQLDRVVLRGRSQPLGIFAPTSTPMPFQVAA